MVAVRNGYGMANQQCLSGLNAIHTRAHTHTISYTYVKKNRHHFFKEDNPTISPNYCMKSDVWVIFYLFYVVQIWQLLSDHLYG